MGKLMNRFFTWLQDPFGKEKIRKHEDVLSAMHQTTERTYQTIDTLIDERPQKFPVGHMIGSAQLSQPQRTIRRA